MTRITGQAELCFENAEYYRKLADDIESDEASRRRFRELAVGWLELAKTFRRSEEVSGYIEWQARRVDPPPGFSFEY